MCLHLCLKILPSLPRSDSITSYLRINFDEKICWSTFRAICSQNHLVTLFGAVPTRFTRWSIYFQIQVWINFGGSCNWRFWYILCPFGMFYGHLLYGCLVYLMAIWYILWLFGISYGHLVYLSFVHLVYLMAIRYTLWPFGISYGHLVYLTAIWYILLLFGIFFPVLVCCTKEKSSNPALSFEIHCERGDWVTLGPK
jgi:hypothetical protein